MYIVKRRINESIAIGDHIVVQILCVNSALGEVTMGLIAPKSAPIKKIPTLTQLPRVEDEVDDVHVVIDDDEDEDELTEAERRVD